MPVGHAPVLGGILTHGRDHDPVAQIEIADADRLAGVLNDILSSLCDPGHDLVGVQRVQPPRRNAPAR